MIQVKAFGQVAEIIQKHEWEITAPISCFAYRKQLLDTYPALQEIPFVFSINRLIVHKDELILDHSELAILPPFSGG